MSLEEKINELAPTTSLLVKSEVLPIAAEADELIDALADAVKRYESGKPAEIQADHAINLYNNWKERTR